MSIRRSLLVCASAFAASMSASYAGPCWDDIGSMQAKIDAKLEAKAAAGPPAPASDMAGMSAQPTPLSMATVEERMGEISPQRFKLWSKPWRVRVQPMPAVTRPHASRLWPRCSALLVDSSLLEAAKRGGLLGGRNGNFQHGLWTAESMGMRRAIGARVREIRALRRATGRRR